jgi:hypothetical protein
LRFEGSTLFPCSLLVDSIAVFFGSPLRCGVCCCLRYTIFREDDRCLPFPCSLLVRSSDSIRPELLLVTDGRRENDRCLPFPCSLLVRSSDSMRPELLVADGRRENDRCLPFPCSILVRSSGSIRPELVAARRIFGSPFLDF